MLTLKMTDFKLACDDGHITDGKVELGWVFCCFGLVLVVINTKLSC